MAKFEINGFSEAESMIAELARNAPATVDAMLNAGARVVVEAQRQAIRRFAKSGRSIGTRARSIAATKLMNVGVHRAVDVYPQGNQPHGSPRRGKKGKVSNAAVGFILEHGRSDMPARPWMSEANEKSAGAVQDAMSKVWEERQ